MIFHSIGLKVFSPRLMKFVHYRFWNTLQKTFWACVSMYVYIDTHAQNQICFFSHVVFCSVFQVDLCAIVHA